MINFQPARNHRADWGHDQKNSVHVQHVSIIIRLSNVKNVTCQMSHVKCQMSDVKCHGCHS